MIRQRRGARARLAYWLWVHDIGFKIAVAMIAIGLLAQIVAPWLPST